jgi:hypothetical protein
MKDRRLGSKAVRLHEKLDEQQVANTLCSGTFSHRYVLPQVHSRGQRQERQTGSIRGAVYEAVCRSVLGCEYGGTQGVGEAEAINVEVMRQRMKKEEVRDDEYDLYDMVVNMETCTVQGMQAQKA